MCKTTVTADPETARRIFDDDLRIITCESVFRRVPPCCAVLIMHNACLGAEPVGALAVLIHGMDKPSFLHDVFTDAANDSPVFDAIYPVHPQLSSAILIDGTDGTYIPRGIAGIAGEGAVFEAEQSIIPDPNRSGAVLKNWINLRVCQPLRFCVHRDGLRSNTVQPVINGSDPDIAFPVHIVDC